MSKPVIVVDPQPRDLDEIFDDATRVQFEQLGELVVHDGPGRMPTEIVERLLPDRTGGPQDHDVDRARHFRI